MDQLTTAADLFVCPNCGTETPGKFCFHCGQKRPVDADLSLRHAIEHVGEELLHVDGKVPTTVKLLFTRPWQLALDFLEGRRARHVHPLRLFLTFGAVFFLLQASTMTTVFEGGLGRRVTDSMRAQAQEEGVPFETVVEHNDHRLAILYKSSFIAGTLLTGVWLWLFYRRDYPYLAQHMVVSLYFSCIAMTAVFVASALHAAFGSGPQNPTALGGGRFSSLVILLTNFSLGRMMSRVYVRGEKGFATQVRFAAVMLLVLLSVLILPTFVTGRYVRSLLP
jgi:hypothetical protein